MLQTYIPARRMLINLPKDACASQLLLTTSSVIFSYWTKMLDLIGNTLDERGLAFQRIDGQSSLPQRKESIEKFSKDPQCNILLASIGAAGEGYCLDSP